MKYSVLYEVYASTRVEVELSKSATRDEVIAAANKIGPNASVCHQCSRSIEVGDIGGVLEVLDDKGDEIPGKRKK